MSNVMQLIGGSAGMKQAAQPKTARSSARIGLFKNPDIRPVFPAKDTPIDGFLLPCFDPNVQSFDTTYATSFGSYRDADVIDPESYNPQFTSWFVSAPGYTWFGESGSTFLSPEAVGGVDPIVQLRKHIYGLRRQGDTTYMDLVTKPANYKDLYPLPPTSVMTLINAVCPPTNRKEEDQSVRNRVLVLKAAATRKLMADLDMARPATVLEPVDPDWPNYMYGDVTNPARALSFRTAMALLETGTAYPALHFGSMEYVDRGEMRVACTKVAVEEKYLRGRFNLTDTENVIHIPSYDEIVALLVEEGHVPYELIMQVCGDMCEHIPSRKSTPVISTPPAAPAPAPSPAPAPAPAPAGRMFWVTLDGAVKSMPESELMTHVDSGFNGAVMMHGETTWKTLSDYGIAAKAPEPPPAAPMPSPAPAPAPAPATPSTPHAGAPMPNPVATPSAAPAEQPAANVARRTKEQEEQFKDYMRRIDDMNPAMKSDEIQAFIALRKLAPYQE